MAYRIPVVRSGCREGEAERIVSFFFFFPSEYRAYFGF